MGQQILVTIPWQFATLAGEQLAEKLDENFQAIAIANLSMGVRLQATSTTVIDPDDNYSRFLCLPVTSMSLTLPVSVSTNFAFWVNNLNAASPALTVTLIGTITIDGIVFNNPVLPGDFGTFTNVRGGLVVWDGVIWTLYPQFQ